MPVFVYKAKTSGGTVINGKFDVLDEKKVVSLLREKDLFPLEVKKDSIFEKDIKSTFFSSVKKTEIIIFCRQFYTMLNAGVNVTRCLDLLRKQTANEEFADVLNRVLEGVQSGELLSEALGKYPKIFPGMITSMVEIGEATGNLDDIFDRLSTYLEKDEHVRQKVKTAMIYPIIIGIIALGTVTIMMIFVVPKFVNLFQSMGIELPFITQMLINTSEFLRSLEFLIGAPIGFFLLKMGFTKFKNSKKGSLFIADSLLKIPYISITIKKVLASRFTRSLGILLKTGVPLVQSLDITSKLVDNVIITKNMERVKDEIGRGVELSQTIDSIGIFPVMVIHMISVGEEAGSLDVIVHKIADFYDEELNTSIARLVAILEPLMILVIASIVGLIVISMILPIFSIYKGIN